MTMFETVEVSFRAPLPERESAPTGGMVPRPPDLLNHFGLVAFPYG